jgi:hypothetical protein
MDGKRTGYDFLRIAIAIGALALWGGIAKQLVRYNPRETWPRRIGGAMASVAIGMPTGLYIWDSVPIKDGHAGIGGVLLGTCLACWAGAELLDVSTRHMEQILQYYRNKWTPKEQE